MIKVRRKSNFGIRPSFIKDQSLIKKSTTLRDMAFPLLHGRLRATTVVLLIRYHTINNEVPRRVSTPTGGGGDKLRCRTREDDVTDKHNRGK